ncbi:MAG: GNAT family N-acetyltransferase [Bosea sp. (in: a-proteobacteria)]
MSRATIRPATNADGERLAALIADCFGEYEGCLYEPAEFPELLRPADHYAALGARLWCVDGPDGTLVGSISAREWPARDQVEIGKMYVAQSQRGNGLAQRLMTEAMAFAQASGAREMMLWTDTRFTRAHAFYEKHGFVRQIGERALGDVSLTWEYHYRLMLPHAASAP